MSNIQISDCKNLIVKVFIIGYSQKGESIVMLFLDKLDNSVLYSIVIDCFSYKGINKTDEILSKYNITNINMLCWSHPDSDHTKGIDVIINKYCSQTTKIILPQGLNGKDYDLIGYNKDDKKIINRIIKLNQRMKKVQLTASVSPNLYQPMDEFSIVNYPDKISVNIHALSPHSSLINERIGNDKKIKKNDLSVVLFVEIGNSYKFVFCSDIENYSINSLKRDCFEEAILVKIPHHTSTTSDDLLSMLVNQDNNMLSCTTVYKAHNLPDANLLQKYKSKCTRVYTTGTKETKINKYGIIEYTFDFYDEKNIHVKCYGHAHHI